MTQKLPITAIISSKNEGHLLIPCLKSIECCAQIIFIDQKSTDDSITVAKTFTNDIFEETPVIAIEQIRAKYIDKALFDWILLVDPDERISDQIFIHLRKIISLPSSNQLAGIKFPYDYHVGDRKLKGTVWGNQSILRLIHRKRVLINSNIHKSILPKNKFQIKDIPRGQNISVHHLWVQNLEHLKSKHENYLLSEGQSMYNRGNRFNRQLQIKETLTSFLGSFIKHAGYLDGILGMKLSIIYSQYIWGRWEMLRRYQQENGL